MKILLIASFVWLYGIIGIIPDLADSASLEKSESSPGTGKVSGVFQDVPNRDSSVRLSMVLKIQNLAMDAKDDRNNTQIERKMPRNVTKEMRNVKKWQRRIEDEISNFEKELRSEFTKNFEENFKSFSIYVNETLEIVPQDCMELLQSNPDLKGKNGKYEIYLDGDKKSVYCDMSTDGGGWTVTRPYTYSQRKAGMNSVLVLRDITVKKTFARYSSFSVGDEQSKYKLSVSGYNGTAGNGLTYHSGANFTTKDQDNDEREYENSAEILQGG
ncbi:angiopoietin-2-like [Saccostrea echinata]|uniref:angiopoietin-2-like n=1 Tax=Saccostrea echinata TaxID=191078 RepID=UPI002A806077|nr:angiopoietin-2-like [Saccostrea echinata]